MFQDDNPPRIEVNDAESAVQNEIARINEALKQFMTHATPVSFDENEFSDEMSLLTQNLNQLFVQYGELKNFSIDLAAGRLTGDMPARNNWLAGPLKSLHAQMLHLSWQAKQVADGDYNQIVDFMGDFSEAFNRMILQLSEREEQLTQGQKAMSTVLEHTPNSVIVIDAKTHRILFQNEAAQLLLADNQLVEQNDYSSIEQALINFDEECDICTWNLSCANATLHLRVHSSKINWLHEKAYLHTLRDVTEEKLAAEELRAFAYYDRSTGVNNRNSGLEYLNDQLSSQHPFIAVFIDMDGLKHINDTFGHVAGDSALRELAQTLHGAVRDDDYVFRMGGDEFLIVFHKADKNLVARIIKRVRSILLVKNQQLDYDISFSVGTYMYDGQEALKVEELLQMVDNIMYLEKRQKKGAR